MITVTLENPEELFAALASVAEHAGNMRVLAPVFAPAWYGKAKGWLDTGGRGSFPELTEAYARRKAKEFGQQPILRASGKMEAALTGKDAPDSIFEVSESELTMGAGGRSGEIASYHQMGTSRTPQRSPYDSLIVNEFAEEDVPRLASEELTAYARTLGLTVVT